LIKCRIVLKDIEDLYGHEQVVRPQVEFLKDNLKRLGYFFRPILIVKKYNVVLDGHHRVQALKEMGGVRIPCIEIDYLDNPEISLATWYPIYVREADKFRSSLERMGIESRIIDHVDKHTFDDPQYGFVLHTYDGNWLLKGSQQEIYQKFLNEYNPEKFEYVKTLDYAFNSVRNHYASFTLLRKTLTKKDVIDTARSGNVYAPKTTRHILTFRYQDIKVPLKGLIEDT
jgi:hypothetical protein